MPQISLCPPLKGVTLSIPIVKSSHSRIFYLNFSWNTNTIGDPRGPIIAWKQQKNTSNHQIFLCPPLMWVMLSIPIVKPIVEYFILTSHSTLGCSLGTIGEPWVFPGANKNLKKSKTCLKPDTFPFPTSTQAAPSFPLLKSFHRRIFYLNFSRHSKSSIERHWGLLN